MSSFLDPLPGLVLRMICALGNPIFFIQHMMPTGADFIYTNTAIVYFVDVSLLIASFFFPFSLRIYFLFLFLHQ
jgi:hypothetical protein